MSILTDLFNKILESEETIRQRFDKLKEVNSEIIKYQDRIKEVTFEEKSLWGTIAVKTQKLMEAEVELNELGLKEKIMEKQIKDMREKNSALEAEIILEETEENEARSNFVREAEDFNASYDLSVDLGARHEQVWVQQLHDLNEEKQQLLKEKQQLEENLKSMDELDERSESLACSMKQKQALRSERSKELKSLREAYTGLITKRDCLVRKPNNDYEFIRLRKELEDLQKKIAQLQTKRQELTVFINNDSK